MSASQPKWLLEVADSYLKDDFCTTLMAKLAVDNEAVPHFSLNGGLLRYKYRIWIGGDKDLQLKLIQAFHSTVVGGHSGIPVTYRRMKQLFAWNGMKSIVHTFIKACLICQQAKHDRSKYAGLLQPLPIPEGASQNVSIDFVEGLPQSRHVNCILVVVDKFTRYAHFLPLKHPYTTSSVAKLYLDQIYKLYGMPLTIISDRDRIFTSRFWQELFSLAQVQLRMSTTYDP
jgi:hypothetical protein